MTVWREQEEDYLRKLENSCVQLSREYHDIYFSLKTSQNKFKIPAIIIGSFTGVASFGSSNFPSSYQKWISITVGIINVAIAILNTLETFFKLGEELSASRSSSEQLKKLAEDINRELSLELTTRQTSGVIFLRDSYTRYQQILSNAPVLTRYTSYLLGHEKKTSVLQKVGRALKRTMTIKNKTSSSTSVKDSLDIESNGSDDQGIIPRNKYSMDNIQEHLNNLNHTSPQYGSPINKTVEKSVSIYAQPPLTTLYDNFHHKDNEIDHIPQDVHRMRLDKLKQLSKKT
jgi:sulfur relay (sulfurtransferase) DsrC/TusE family protein